MDFRFVHFEDNYREAWDTFVTANPHAWPGQDAAIIDFERSRGHASFSHLAYSEGGQLVAVAPMFLLTQRQARFFHFRILTSGSTLRGGPLLRADMPPKLRQQFMAAWTLWLDGLARRERIDAIRVAFPHVIGDQLSRDFYEYYPLRGNGFVEQAGLTLLMDLTVPGDLFNRLTKECRKAVRRAKKDAVEFQLVSDRETWLSFHELNLEFSKTKEFPPYSEESMAILWDRFIERGLAHAFYIRHEGRAICAMIVAGTRHSCYAWIGFNRIPRPVIGASNLLMYSIMEWMRQSGRHYFELGSMEFHDAYERDISHNKQSFGGRPHYGLDGVRVVSGLKQASVDWMRAAHRKLKGEGWDAG
jgi:hypothetical protein